MSKVTVGFVPGWDRPVRIPENVPILHADPAYAIAGEESMWRLAFRLSANLPPGAPLKLELWSHRNNKGVFEAPQVDDMIAPGYLSAATAAGRPLALRPDEPPGAYAVELPEGGLAGGDEVFVTLGAGTKAPVIRMLNKFFLLYCGGGTHRPTVPRGRHRIVGACTMHILGGPIHHIRAYAPAQTEPGRPIEIVIRGEDERHNLSCTRVRDPAVFLGEKQLPAAAERVAGSTCVRARVMLPEAGTHRLRIRDATTGCETLTNPIVCAVDRTGPNVYWGMIHGHTEMSDGQGTLDYYFRQMRDEALLDFGGTGDHDHPEETSDAMWDATCQAVADYNAPGRFVALLGYEWARWRRNGDGDRNVYYLDDKRPIYRSDESDCPTPPDLFAALAAADEKAIIIPHHTAHDGNWCDFRDHDPERERLIEIFQLRGSYECSAEDGNTLGEREYPEPMRDVGYVRRALAMGWRAGFTAGGDDHLGHPGQEYPYPQPGRYKAGLMSVQADRLDRHAVFQAMWHRRVVATTGPRMLLDFRLSGNPMGSELSAADTPELDSRRVVEVSFHGTAPVKQIDVIRSGVLVHSAPADGPDAELAWADETPLQDALLPPAKFCDHPFCYYYVRVIQADEEVAWASPVWIDPGP